MRSIPIALAPGDGAAPEMMDEAVKTAVMAAEIEGVSLVFRLAPMGWSAFAPYGDTFPQRSYEIASQCGTLFFGGVGEKSLDATLGVKHKGMKPEPRCLLGMRGGWELLLNFRPVVYWPAIRHLSKVKDLPDGPIEQHWVRFLLEDSYFGNRDMGQYLTDEGRHAIWLRSASEVTGQEDKVSEIAYYSRARLQQYCRHVFEYAKARSLPVISVTKANMMGRYMLWDFVCKEVALEFPNVPVRHEYVDTACAMLFHPASLHGVIACGNEHGDILSDGAAECWGSMGMMHSSSINPSTGQGMFESGAGTAPDLKGRNVANPLGRILTAALMLHHLKLHDAAGGIEKAVAKALEDGARTKDIAKPGETVVSCTEMGKLVRSALRTSL